MKTRRKKRRDMQYFTVNVNFKAARTDYLEGEEYYVAPVVLMTPDVHEGSQGALLYLGEDLEVYSPAWNHKPIVLNHPKKGIACTQNYLNTNKMGVLLGTGFEREKQRAEAWFHKKRTAAVCPKVLKAVKNGQRMEVSTGLFVDAKGGPGKYRGKKYEAIARNHRPDHLAILPDSVGACSVKDGGGLFPLNSKLSRQKAQRFIDRRIKRALKKSSTSQRKEDTMKRREYVDKLIENELTSFEKKDRKWLMALNAVQLKKLQPKKKSAKAKVFTTQEDFKEAVNDEIEDRLARERRWQLKLAKNKRKKVKVSNADPDDDDDGDDDDESLSRKKKSKKNGKKVLNGKSLTKKLKDYLDNDVPRELRPVLNAALRTAEKEHARLVQMILSNENNPFDKAELKLMDPEQLRKLAVLSRNKEDDEDEDVSFFGAAVPRSVRNSSNDEEGDDPLDLPQIDNNRFALNGGKGLRRYFGKTAVAKVTDDDGDDDEEFDDED